jgi:hypothetical protein
MKVSAGRLLAAAFLATIGPALTSQTLNPSARDLLNASRPLQPAEIAVVLAAVRDAVSGRTCRLSYAPMGPGPEMLMGPNGRPRFMRTTSGYDYASGSSSGADAAGTTRQQRGHVDLVTFTDYTGRPARSCEGAALEGELVIEYERRSTDDRWTVKARTRTVHELAAPVFDMLAGTTSAQSGERRSIDGRVARALVAPWVRPDFEAGRPRIDATQSLWIDADSMLPLRWSISIEADPERSIPAIPDYGVSFTYDAPLDLKPPSEIAAPDCVR